METRAQSPEHLTAAMFHIILAMASGRRHGYEIMREVGRISRHRVKLGPGTLYRSLKKMLSEGLIEEVHPPPRAEGAGTRRRLYRLTDLGNRVGRAKAGQLAVLVDEARRHRLLVHVARPSPRAPGSKAVAS